MAKYARVLVDQAARIFNKTFDYSIPDNLAGQIVPGVKVLVPFGPRKIPGYVMETTDTSTIANIKPLLAALTSEKIFNDELRELAGWLADYYGCYLISALKTVLIFEEAYTPKKLQKKENPVIKNQLDIKVSQEYQKISGEIAGKIFSSNQKKILIAGEQRLPLYLKLMAENLAQNKSAILTVPEEFMAAALGALFNREFPGRAALYKNTASHNEKRLLLEKIKSGELKILVGTRSVVFAPFENPGLIIVDQEENPAFKQEKNPRYQTLKVAEKRAEISGARLVAGSSAPTLETYSRAAAGELVKYVLPPRKDRPQIIPIDLNEPRPEKNNRKSARYFSWIIPLPLQIEISHALARKKPVLIFINRLGFFTSAVCKKCGEPYICPDCRLPLAYNKMENKFSCHHCKKVFSSLACRVCHDNQYRLRGLGSERVAGDLKKLFPASEIVRVDSLAAAGDSEKIMAEARKHRQAIFVATKLGLKLGLKLHFKTVGFLGFDSLLNLPDFRAGEKLFQLLYQFFSEYFKSPEKIIIPTHHPDHPIFKAFESGPDIFYQAELATRKALNYPPFFTLVILNLAAREPAKIKAAVEKLQEMMPLVEFQPLSGRTAARQKFPTSRFLLKIPTGENSRQLFNNFLSGLDSKIEYNLDIDPLEVF